MTQPDAPRVTPEMQQAYAKILDEAGLHVLHSIPIDGDEAEAGEAIVTLPNGLIVRIVREA